MGILYFIREVFELNAEVDGDHAHAGRNADRHRSEVENAQDPARHHMIGHPLSRIGRNAKYGQSDVSGIDGLMERFDRLDHESVMGSPDLLGVIVEQGDDMETTGSEPAVSQECPA